MNPKNITKIALLTAILCIIAPMSLNIFIVPFSFSTLIIMIYSCLFNRWISLASIVLYILLGAIGLPVFSMYQGGISKLLSITGGFIFSYPVANIFISTFYKKNYCFIIKYIILLISNIIIYAMGVIYFCFISNTSIIYGVSVAVVPFLVTDNIKIVLAIIMSDKLMIVLKKYNI